MSARIVAILLVVLSLGLGAGLYVVLDKASKERAAAAAAADQLKGELVRSESRLNEQVKVNASLETNLVRRVEEVGLYSNKLDFIAAELAKTEEEAKAAAEKARLELEEREKRIVGLKGEKDELTARLDEMSLKIQGLRTQIAETERRLASSEGDREVLKKELRRMLAEKADLEKRFADLSEVNAQIRKLREEAYVARRMEIIRKGVINFDQKGAMLLQQGIRRNVATNPPMTDGRLNVELKPDGTGRVLPSEPTRK
jgi:chromosome segregation ATPase